MRRSPVSRITTAAPMCWGAAWLAFGVFAAASLAGQGLLEGLADRQDFRSRRVSSFDRTGGNADSIRIEPGETAVLAEIKGPGAVHHIWVTISAEAFYGRKIVLRVYWDGEEAPSVESPIGDFFGVGHGLNRNLSSLPIACTSEGRARNCYWFMPFRKSCRITATNEGLRSVSAFYYYVDYRELGELGEDVPYFHASYRQEFPCAPERDYVLLEAEGRGHYVGSVLSLIQRSLGWWGEGDDRFTVDGEAAPSLHGTGSEDYFSDAWGMREDENLFYGCPLQEDDFQAGSKASVYRFHVPDPVPFRKSIRVTIEHGHANDRSDDYSSVAFWYQAEPHRPFPALPPVAERLPFALEPPQGFLFPEWEEETAGETSSFVDPGKGLGFSATRLVPQTTSLYGPDGGRYPALQTDGLGPGDEAEIRFSTPSADLYSVELYFLKGPAAGNVDVLGTGAPAENPPKPLGTFEGYAAQRELASVEIASLIFGRGTNSFRFRVSGKDGRAAGMDIAFVGLRIRPAARRFNREWNLIGPFPAPDMNDLQTPFPPEREFEPGKTYPGVDGAEVGWRKIRAEPEGYIDLRRLVRPNEKAVVYAMAYVFSPDDRPADLFIGTDDGVKLWVNGEVVHTNPAYRAAAPDQDLVEVSLRKGWNPILVKVLQGAGGWGFYVRIADPLGELRWALEPSGGRRP